MDEDLPTVPTSIAKEHPNLWSAYAALGQAARQSGPLDARTCRLVHLALAMGADSEGATHSHVRRGLAEGLTGDELEHVAQARALGGLAGFAAMYCHDFAAAGFDYSDNALEREARAHAGQVMGALPATASLDCR